MPEEKPPQLLIDTFGEATYLDPAEKHAARARKVARLRLLWRNRQRVLRVTVIGMVLSTVLAFLIPKRFESTARLMPPERPNSSVALLGMLTGKSTPGSVGNLADEFLGVKNSGDLFMGVLKSRTVEDDLITKFNLRRVYHKKEWEDAREKLAEKTEISEDRKSGIISVSVRDHDPQRAAGMVQEYIDELNTEVTLLNTSSAHRERVFLEDRLAHVQQDLEMAEKDFSQFASKNTALDIKEQGRAMISAGAGLEAQLIAAQTELEGLKQIYTDDNVRVRTVQARIDELRRQIRKLGGTTGQQSPGSPNNGQSPKEEDGQLYPGIRQLPVLGVTWADLYRRAEVQEKVFETLTQEYELTKVEEARETPSVKVLDPPDIPEKGFPPRPLLILVGTVTSLMLGIALVIGGAHWQEVDPHDPGKILAIEVFEGVKSLASTNGSQNGVSKKGIWSHVRKHTQRGSEGDGGDS